jgi:hypothetical protein
MSVKELRFFRAPYLYAAQKPASLKKLKFIGRRNSFKFNDPFTEVIVTAEDGNWFFWPSSKKF